LNLADHSIWQNSQGIASKLKREGDGFILWPGNHEVESHKLMVSASEPGTVKIDVKLSDGQKTFIHAVYPELCELRTENQRQLTEEQADFQKKFRRGDPRASAMLPNIHALCGEDVNGNTVKLIWHVRDNQTAQLVDIEYPVHHISDRATYGNVQKINFRCDPMDLDQVTGLVMALEDKMAAGELEGPVIQQAFDTIETHRKALESEEALEASPKINAAVKEATDALWQTIDSRFKPAFDKQYYELHRNDSLALLRAEVAVLEVKEPSDTKGKLKRFITGKKGKEKGRLRAIQKIVGERVAELERIYGYEKAQEMQLYVDWQEMAARLARKLN
jgi:hypothetical protein